MLEPRTKSKKYQVLSMEYEDLIRKGRSPDISYRIRFKSRDAEEKYLKVSTKVRM